MQSDNSPITEREKEYCAVTVMRRAVEKYAQTHGKNFDDAMFLFANSPVYEALFDYDTGIWREGPDYLVALLEEGATNS